MNPQRNRQRRAATPYADGTGEQPLRAALFTIEQLEVHARALAVAHVLDRQRSRSRLLSRLSDSQRLIAAAYEVLADADAAGRRLAPAAEWLLDNHYLVEEQMRLARRHLPRGYSRQLPHLKNGELAGHPRIYDLILQLISHVDGRIDAESLGRYLAAYQSVTHLSLGELWAVPIMLRLALIENLRRVTAGVVWRRFHRDRALVWATRINEAASKPDSSVVLVLADLVREDPPLSTAFVAQFTQAIQSRGATVAFILSWLEQRLAQQGQVIEEMVRAEGQSQAADQVSMANSIASLRFVNATDWHEFVETHSVAERILRGDPAGIYARMDFATRDDYRHAVESISRRLGVPEEQVARKAVALAAELGGTEDADVYGHVGFYLVDGGRHQLMRTLRGRSAGRRGRERRWHAVKLSGYLLAIMAMTAIAAAPLAMLGHAGSRLFWSLLSLSALLAASQWAVAVTNWVASILRSPRALPRMDFEKGIPDTHRTVVAVPAMLGDEQRVAELLDDLELRYLANRPANLWFCLLTDWVDAPAEHTGSDQPLLDLAVRGIEELNRKYGGEGSEAQMPFFLLHRPRRHNPEEGCWMGRERKRGKLEDFTAVLRGQAGGATERFSRIVGDVSRLASVRYVITLDADTELPWGAGWRLVGTAAHPLNRAIIDADRARLRRGYVILQPRVSISLRSARRSRYARLLAGDVGIDPYTRVVSDVYQDLFGEASFIGKGIYDVDAFRTMLEGRFPPNTVLSHDLLESCHARCGLVSDVELLEDHPSRYVADVDRRHRWMRGDWQIAPWLGLRVRDATGRRVRTRVTALGRWKILDNLRRSLVPAALVTTLCMGWLVAPMPGLWTAWVLSLLLIPELLPGIQELLQKPRDLPVRLQLSVAGHGMSRRLGRFALGIAVLPFEAMVALDATLRTLWRMLYSRRHLLQWQTAAATERCAAAGLLGVTRRMWAGPFLALVMVATLHGRGTPVSATVAAAAVLSLWFLSPLLAWWIGQPLRGRLRPLEADDALFVRRVARMTWRFFEDLVGPQENWMPPDNLQEVPQHRVAHRTSPTNMGLSLLANLAAHDLGYLSTSQFLDRTAQTVESMEQLERHRGHFFNWYDTRTRKAIRPFYVSTVDSGNLVGHLAVLRRGLLELPSRPLISPSLAEGLNDTFRVLDEQFRSSGEGTTRPVGVDASALQWARQLLSQRREGPVAMVAWLRDVHVAAVQIAGAIQPDAFPEASWWAHAMVRQAQAMLDDLGQIAPWLWMPRDGFGGATRDLADRLVGAASLSELVDIGQRVLVPGSDEPMPQEERQWREAVQTGITALQARLREVESLAQHCADLGEADFSFLYDRPRKLLALGYNVADRRLDNGHYDLLASEARLVSYLMIASGTLPVDHWFALGRSLTMVRGMPALLSWSGSMFEYLMPLLVMPTFEGTLLEESYQSVVKRQAEYGRQRGVPWGISESGYNLTDTEGSYQYRAFGVPGLGLQRGLSDDLVIAPYATALALLVDPRMACRNLRRLADEGYLGSYGYYEAIDYTASRLPASQSRAVVRSFMAHHQGMSLLAMTQAVAGTSMHRRFMESPAFRAADLLLQERVPRTTSPMHPHEREAGIQRRPAIGVAQPSMRVVTNPSQPIPEVHLLSNGRYHVCVTAAGGGYSRWNDLAITRWREDPTADSWGVFCYVSDPDRNRFWSAAFQPTLRAGRDYEAIFTQGRAEFRRQDERVETHADIAVSPEDDLEIRRITLTNRSDAHRSLVISTYAEAVLAPQAADELHPAFSNLFVQTEIEPHHNAILLTRRPRSAEEKPPWVFCILQPPDGAAKCTFETDRARFLGRGRSPRRPLALDHPGPLSGTSGAVLDPCLAARCSVELAADQSVRVDLIIGAAPTREAALALVMKYQDRRLADRVFELAATHSQVVLGHMGGSEEQAQLYGRLASGVIYASGAYRAPASVLRRNRKGQSGLWGYGISGDNPIVLLRIADTANLRLVRELLMAHAYWRVKGLVTDLLILNEDVSGYRQTLNDQIMGLIAAGTEVQLVDKPGGIFVRHVDQIAEEDRVLMQATARIVISDADGPLEEQLTRRAVIAAPPAGAALVPSRRSLPRSEPRPGQTGLKFSNGVGGFTEDGREYIVALPPDRPTPAPWVNVIANPRLGTVVTESGTAYTWFENAQLCRLTPWDNDPVCQRGGEMLLIRDDDAGRFFSATPLPHAGHHPHICRHGFGYSIFEHAQDGIESQLTVYVAVGAPVKFLSLKLKNTAGGRRTISVLASFDLVMGDLRSRNAMHVVTELEPRSGAILARNSYSTDFADAVAFLDCSEPGRTVSGDCAEVLGRNGERANPAAMRLRRLSGRLGPAMDPCAAMQVRLDLAESEERQVVFIFGAGRGSEEAISLIQRYRGVGAARVALEEVWKYWNDKLGIIYAETPDLALNVLVNGWLPYQILSCRFWGRSGFYQSAGAWGFRDQLQDCLALLHEAPDLARQHLLRCAARMFPEGDVQHWWHAHSGRGVRTACSDDYLWLPYAVCRYVSFTGDTGVLDEKVGYLNGRALRPDEDSYYDLPERSERIDTLYEHCVCAIGHALREGGFGAHHLPLIGSGDWNDGMNRVGVEGRGESVWVAFFLHHVLSLFSGLARDRGDAGFAERCVSAVGELAVNIEKHAWDGDWYRRAFFDNGEPLGSSQNPECRIDLLPQSWAVISGAGDRQRQRRALDAAWEQLVRQDAGIVQLLTPPFDQSALDPGYIKGYVPGVRENGGQYTHAAVWAAMAFALAGRIDQAFALVTMLNPINHTLDARGLDRYKVEPYVMAADVYFSPAHVGRGGWTWYTGSAGWFYRLLHEVLLGLDRRADEVRFCPRVPHAWREYKVHYRYYQTFYHITFRQSADHRGHSQVVLDGQPQPGGILKLVNDMREHGVDVLFGPSPNR